MPSLVLIVVILVFGGTYMALQLRFIKTTRRMRSDADLERWRAVEPARRKAIVQTMRQGLPVRDPADAELALEASDRADRVRKLMRPMSLFGDLAIVVIVVVGIATSVWFVAIIGGSGLVVGAVLTVLSRQRRRRIHESVEATRRLIKF